MMESVLTDYERLCYVATNGPAKASRQQLGQRFGVSPAQVSRWLTSAGEKIDELRRLCDAADGDPAVVEQYLANLPPRGVR